MHWDVWDCCAMSTIPGLRGLMALSWALERDLVVQRSDGLQTSDTVLEAPVSTWSELRGSPGAWLQCGPWAPPAVGVVGTPVPLHCGKARDRQHEAYAW